MKAFIRTCRRAITLLGNHRKQPKKDASDTTPTMPKSTKKDDPLRARTSRVEKPRRPKKTRDDLPKWFFRVKELELKEKREVFGRDLL